MRIMSDDVIISPNKELKTNFTETNRGTTSSSSSDQWKTTTIKINNNPNTPDSQELNSQDHSKETQGDQTSSAPPRDTLKEAVFTLFQAYYYGGGSENSELLKSFVNFYCEKMLIASPPSSPSRSGSIVQVDSFSCPVCYGIFVDPVTIQCGHSYCRKCLNMESPGKSCRRCKHVLSSRDIGRKKVNVLVSSLVEKWWPNYLEANNYRTEGNMLFEQNMGDLALVKYSQAIEKCGDDHLSLGNRAQALLTLGRSEEALKDAEAAIRSCSVWAKGYFRKSVTLSSLGRYEEAFITLTLCLYLVKATQINDELAVLPLKNELIKVLHKIFLRPLYSNRRHSVDTPHAFAPYPQIRARLRRNNTHFSNEELNSGDEGEEVSSLEPYKRTQRMSGSSIVLVLETIPPGRGRNRVPTSTAEQNYTRINRVFDHAFAETKRIQMEVLERTRTVADTATDPSIATKRSSILRHVDKTLISAIDFECTLCYRLLYQPVTTTCGHTFCRSCLERCLDHSSACPLCKTSLVELIVHHKPCTTYFLEIAMNEFLSDQVVERANQHREEVEMGAGGGSREFETPIFVCTIGFPTVPCPLHVFEPRYRLMIRRSMETGSRRFGMCCYSQDCDGNYADYGTLLEIRNVQYFADGRSVVDTIGAKRFRVIKRSQKDGYNTATVEILHDRALEPAEMTKLKEIHDQVFTQATSWLESINQVLRQRIQTHFGNMPGPEDDWMDLPDGPGWAWWLLAILPLDTKAQLAILSMNNLQKRLESILKVLTHVTSNNM